jgi:hypothetical protein
MRRILGVAALAAAFSLIACESQDGMRRQGRTPSRTDRVNRPAAPPSEVRPTDNSPLRGDETYPSEYPASSPGNTGTSPTTPGGMGTSTSPSTTVPTDVPTPPPGGAYNPRSGDRTTSPYPYGDLEAGKTVKDGGSMGGADGGTHLENVPRY